MSPGPRPLRAPVGPRRGIPVRQQGDRGAVRGAPPASSSAGCSATRTRSSSSRGGAILARVLRLRGQVRRGAGNRRAARRRGSRPGGPPQGSASLAAYRAVDGAGLARIDFLVTPDEAFISEMKTLPGLHRHEHVSEAGRAGRPAVRRPHSAAHRVPANGARPMKLKPQPKVVRRRAGPDPPRATPGTRGRGRGARRPGAPFRQRMAGRLPSIRRVDRGPRGGGLRGRARGPPGWAVAARDRGRLGRRALHPDARSRSTAVEASVASACWRSTPCAGVTRSAAGRRPWPRTFAQPARTRRGRDRRARGRVRVAHGLASCWISRTARCSRRSAGDDALPAADGRHAADRRPAQPPRASSRSATASREAELAHGASARRTRSGRARLGVRPR